MNQWENKLAIVTGASAGIGASLAEQLVDAGVMVAGLARRKESLNNLSKTLEGRKGKFYGVVCDICKEEDVLKAFEWIKDNLGPIYILVNNAGIARNTNLIQGDLKLWQEIFDTNVLGLCVATREAIKDMRANQIDGHIININSIQGHKVGYSPVSSVYPASKHAVSAITETLRQELNSVQSKIKISSVSPGYVKTEIGNAAGILSNEVVRQRYASFPMLEAQDVGDAIMFILSTPPGVQINELIIKVIGEIF